MEFVNSSDFDAGGRLVDVNGDGLMDFVRSYVVNQSTLKQVYLNIGELSDRLVATTNHLGGTTAITYKGTPQYTDDADNLLNPALPLTFPTVSRITWNDGQGTEWSTSYEYAGGHFYYNAPYDRRFAGFSTTTEANGLGYITKTMYHQGDGTLSGLGEESDDQSKIGKPYRIEAYDDSNNLYAKTINKWENVDLNDNRDFVKRTQILEFVYDGNEDHKDRAETFVYDDANGNLTEHGSWGEVVGNDNGTFTDMGTDRASTTISYAASTTLHLYRPSQETVTDPSGAKVRERLFYYDGLTLGGIEKGNLTKEKRWVSGSSYIGIERTYNAYGLVIQEKDPRDKATDFAYDTANLYVATTTNPLGHQTLTEYHLSSGKLGTTTDPNGRVFVTVYDGLDRPVEEKQPDLVSPGSLVTKTAYSYTEAATSVPMHVRRTEHLTSATSSETYTYYDGFGRLLQTRQEAEEAGVFAVRDFAYNEIGLPKRESLPYFSNGASTTAATANTKLYSAYAYDPLERVISIANAVGTTSTSYNGWTATTTDPNANNKALIRDAYGNLIGVNEVNGAATYQTRYEYDLNDNLTKINDALGNVRSFTYDGLGRQLTAEDLHDAADTTYGTTTYAYDDAGNLTSKFDGVDGPAPGITLPPAALGPRE